MQGHTCATCSTKIIGDDARPYCSHCMRDMLPALRADIDALTADRDELQRRLDAVVAKISEAVVSDDDCVCSMLCHSAILAIAEDE